MALINKYFGDSANVVHFICRPGVNHQLHGEGGDDVITASASTSGVSLLGGEGNDWLNAGFFEPSRHGYNLLNGGSGQDTLVGSSAREYFFCTGDSFADVIVDRTAGDRDIVIAEGNYTLGTNLEYLSLYGQGDFRGAGNELRNLLKGNVGDNVLVGGGGRDTLSGGGGLDTLVGGRGDDILRLDFGPTVVAYRASSESAVGRSDIIWHLRANDRIDLSAIDADSRSEAANESFSFVGNSAFSTNATGQIRYEVIDALRIRLHISTDRDADAEMQIELLGSSPPSVSNFFL